MLSPSNVTNLSNLTHINLDHQTNITPKVTGIQSNIILNYVIKGLLSWVVFSVFPPSIEKKGKKSSSSNSFEGLLSVFSDYFSILLCLLIFQFNFILEESHSDIILPYLFSGTLGWQLFSLIPIFFDKKDISQHEGGLKSFGAYLGIFMCLFICHFDIALKVINPWGLPTYLLWVVFFTGRLGQPLYEYVSQKYAKSFGSGKLQFRHSAGVTIEDKWTWVDYLYIEIALCLQGVVFGHLTNINISLGGLENMSFTTVIIGGALNCVLTDMFYGLTHYAMHHPIIYPYVHKHHHRHLLPENGYIDVMNYHPIEQLLGSLCIALSCFILGNTIGLHFIGYVVPLAAQVFFQCLNHLDEDVKLQCLFFVSFEAGAHEMHHRIPSCNFTLYSKYLDSFAGVYRSYKAHL